MGTPEFFDASNSSFTNLVDVFAGREENRVSQDLPP